MACQSSWFKAGCLLAGLAVVLGAFAAHGLDRYCVEMYPASETAMVAGQVVPLSFKRLQDFKTGAEYQFLHAFGLIAAGLGGSALRPRWRNVAGWMFVAGIVLFSGSLYAITLTGVRALGAIAPFGGTAFILGWVALAHSACGGRAACGASANDAGVKV